MLLAVAEVVVFHHTLGLTRPVQRFADELRAAGHTVHTPDLCDGRRFETYEEGAAYVDALGGPLAIVERVLGDLPADSDPVQVAAARASAARLDSADARSAPAVAKALVELVEELDRVHKPSPLQEIRAPRDARLLAPPLLQALVTSPVACCVGSFAASSAELLNRNRGFGSLRLCSSDPGPGCGPRHLGAGLVAVRELGAESPIVAATPTAEEAAFLLEPPRSRGRVGIRPPARPHLIGRTT
jgi:hypothetical protein